MALLHLWFPGVVNKHTLAVPMQVAEASGIDDYQPIACTHCKQQEQAQATGGLREGVTAHQRDSNIHISPF